MYELHTMKKRIQVTINWQLVQDAKKMMNARGFDSFSEFLESLIRDEAGRRGLFAVETTESLTTTGAGALNDAVSYKRATRKTPKHP